MVQIYHVNLDLTHTYVVVYFKLYNDEKEEKIGINLNGQKDLKKNFSLEAEIISAGNLTLKLYFDYRAVRISNLTQFSAE